VSEPRRHHLLPQFYMRAFADERGQLRAVPRIGENGPQTAYTASPENILVERDFYAITDDEGERRQIVEEAFARLEGNASDSLRLLLDGGLVLDAEQRAAWSELMAVQVTRGRQFRDSFKEFSGRLGKQLLAVTAANAPDEYFERMNSELEESGEASLPSVPPELRQSLISGDGFDVVPTQEHLVEMSLAAVGELTNIFFRMSWKLLRFERDCLLTSDHPVSYWREPSYADPFFGIGPITAREVRIPLSPRAALVLVHPIQVDEAADAEHGLRHEVARCLNRDLLTWPASKQWLHRPGVAHPLPGIPDAQWIDEWARPWCRNGAYRV
jgi:Protein of unknown function (DUF4238)